MNKFIFGLCIVLSGAAHAAESSTCSLAYAANAVQISWTAYKTTARVPVTGQFKGFTIGKMGTGNTLAEKLIGTEVEVDLLSSTTAKASRDENLRDSFFSQIPGAKAQGRITQAVASDSTHGTLQLELTFNGATHTTPMTYALGADQMFHAMGALEMPDFVLSAALAALDATCHDLHMGMDGISKVWPTVNLMVSVPVTGSCL